MFGISRALDYLEKDPDVNLPRLMEWVDQFMGERLSPPYRELFHRAMTDPDNNWAIDGSLFEHKGDWYMVWSGWQTRRIDTETQCIYIARMANPWTLGSERVLISKPELEWERHYINEDGSHPSYIIYVNEGPQPLKSPNGEYVHIVYSASGCWTSLCPGARRTT